MQNWIEQKIDYNPKKGRASAWTSGLLQNQQPVGSDSIVYKCSQLRPWLVMQYSWHWTSSSESVKSNSSHDVPLTYQVANAPMLPIRRASSITSSLTRPILYSVLVARLESLGFFNAFTFYIEHGEITIPDWNNHSIYRVIFRKNAEIITL